MAYSKLCCSNGRVLIAVEREVWRQVAFFVVLTSHQVGGPVTDQVTVTRRKQTPPGRE